MKQSIIGTTSEKAKTLLDTREAAEFLDLAPCTLNQWRFQGVGPSYVKVGRRSVRYYMNDLVKYLEQGRFQTGNHKDQMAAA